MDLHPLAELVRETFGHWGLTVLAVLVVLGVGFYVVRLGAEAMTAVLRLVREWKAPPRESVRAE
jgi:hypothetical protein